MFLFNILASCKSAFEPSKTGSNWELVFNCAAEIRPNQTVEVYKEGVLKLSLNCAIAAANQNARRFFELSSGYMNSSEKTSLTEDCKLDPWTVLAKMKVQTEKELKLVPNLNLTIIRLPIVYGNGDKRYLMPRIVIAGIYKHLNEPMKLLWNEKLILNTVHVDDVVMAMWALSQSEKSVGETYNIVDDSNTTQGKLSDLFEELFSVKIDYWGIVLSNLTRLNMKDTVSDINDKHMGPWAEICQKDDIASTPLTPYMDEELLYHKHVNLDNSKLKDFGYKLTVPTITADLIKDVIMDYCKQNLFPRSLIM